MRRRRRRPFGNREPVLVSPSVLATVAAAIDDEDLLEGAGEVGHVQVALGVEGEPQGLPPLPRLGQRERALVGAVAVMVAIFAPVMRSDM